MTQQRQILDNKNLSNKLSRQIFWGRIFSAVLAIVLVASCVGLLVLAKLVSDVRSISERTNNEVLCPSIIRGLNTYNPNGPVAQADPALYEENMSALERAARTLNCEQQERRRQ